MDRTLLTDEELSEKMIQVLMRELGPVETARIIAKMNPNQDGKDSVQRHREFAASVEGNQEFFDELIRIMEERARQATDAANQLPNDEVP